MNWGRDHEYIIGNDDVVVKYYEVLVPSNLDILIRTSHSINVRLWVYLISFSIVDAYTIRAWSRI